MNTQDILGLYRYNEWANRSLFDATSALPPAALTRDLGGSFPTLRDVWAHLVSVEWVWLERWRGTSPAAIPEWAVSGDLRALDSRLAEVQTGRRELLEKLTERALSVEVAFRYVSGAAGVHPLHEILLHVVNHSTYHRGQVASMLRQVGAAPPATDFIVFAARTAG